MRSTFLLLSCVVAVSACRHEKPETDKARERAQYADLKRRYEEAKRREAEHHHDMDPAPRGSGASGAPVASGTPASPSAEPPSPGGEPPAHSPRATGNPFFAVDEPLTLGPPAPATATELGAVVNDKDGRLFVLRLGQVGRSPEPKATPLTQLPEGSGPFGLGAGPAFFQNAAYFISHGKLVRRKIAADGTTGPLEILARDALDGTRVAVPVSATRLSAKLPATAAYVVQPPKEDAPLIAKLWIEGAETLTLTAEGNSTHSVGLVRTSEGVMAVSVQARMAMTPVHTRRIGFVSGKPVLSDDLVTWVGSGLQPLNELALVPDGKEDLWGFLPQERSISEFGLARLDIGMTPDMETGTSWLLYPNGIDPAPVSAARVCGKPMLLHTAPETAAPGAPHELVLVSARQDWASAEPFRLDDDRVIYFVSISETTFGALVVWVTDRATRAVTLRCTSGRK